ncbi:MAG TPA: hypothetical protein VGJ81_18010 [Thermoanaerobaculia bacterium]
MSQLVFLTFFLGLVSGQQTVSLNASPDVRTVAILVDEQKVATLQPPFTGTIDLGAKLAPRLLVAVGYDEKGNEVARASQVLNVPRPPADAAIVLSDGNKRAEIHWMQRVHEKPSETLLRVDDRTIPLDASFGAALPPLDPAKPHVIEAELRFASGAVVRRDVTIAGGAYSDSVDAELTPVIVRGDAQREKLSGCFGVRVSAVEKSRAVVVVVKDPDPLPVLLAFWQEYAPPNRSQNWTQNPALLGALPLDRNTTDTILWPVMQERTRDSNPTMNVYASSGPFDAHNLGMLWAITRRNQSVNGRAPRRYADAVAVAGMMAAEQGTRRAVVLLLQPGHKDESAHDAATVRAYLQSIGVPLHVWAINATKEQREAWGDVSDIATPKLDRAVQQLGEDLASQSVAWVATDAWQALRSAAKPCQ